MAVLPRNQSIARRLFYAATLSSIAILLIAGIALSAIYRRSTEQAFDERLGVYLRALVADVASPGDDSRTAPGQLGDPQFELSLSGWYWQITRLDVPKAEIRASRSLFAARLPRLADAGVPAGVGGARAGYVTGPDGRQLRQIERVIDVGEDGNYLVQVAATTLEMEDQIWRFRLLLGVTFVLLALALAGVTALQVRYGLRPLRQLQLGVAAIRRGEGDRIDGAYSDDLAPLAAELNLLIAWNREIVERARTHVGNLAHALKTPLSVIINEATQEGDSPLSLKVQEQAATMRDQVNFYLDRARAAARVSVVGAASEVGPVVDGLVGAFAKIHRNIDFDAEVTGRLRFRGERRDLDEMIGNLVDNAGKWAISTVAIRAAASDDDGQASPAFFDVTIDDDGPGLAAEQRLAALARGQRLDESKPGSGLGLSIVADLAAIHGGQLSLEDGPLGGLRARLHLPSA
jgi:signal transduction histidine kinase